MARIEADVGFRRSRIYINGGITDVGELVFVPLQTSVIQWPDISRFGPVWATTTIRVIGSVLDRAIVTAVTIAI